MTPKTKKMLKENLLAIVVFYAFVGTLMGGYVIIMQDNIIDEEKAKHEVTKVELYNLKQTIADGLCLPRLQM